MGNETSETLEDIVSTKPETDDPEVLAEWEANQAQFKDAMKKMDDALKRLDEQQKIMEDPEKKAQAEAQWNIAMNANKNTDPEKEAQQIADAETKWQEAIDKINKEMEESAPKHKKYVKLDNLEEIDMNNPWKQLTFSMQNHSKNYKLLSDTKVYGKAGGRTETIALSQIVSSKYINKIIFEIKPNDRIPGNIVGILQYPLPYAYDDPDDVKEIDFNEELWAGMPLEMGSFSKGYYAVGTNPMGIDEFLGRQWSVYLPTNGIMDNTEMLDFAFKNGDKFILEFDLRNGFGNVYVNEIKDEYKIHLKKNKHSFMNLPEQFIFVYSYDDRSVPFGGGGDESQYINVTVDVNLIHLEMKHHHNDNDNDASVQMYTINKRPKDDDSD